MLLPQGGLLFGLDVGDELARFDRDRGFGFFHGGKFGQLASSRRIEFFDREQALLLAHGKQAARRALPEGLTKYFTRMLVQ